MILKQIKQAWCCTDNKALLFFIFITAGLGFLPASLCASDFPDRPRRILLIPSHNIDYLGSRRFLRGVMAEFSEHRPFEATLLHENLRLANHQNDRAYMDMIASSLKIKYSQEKPDLIIAQYKPALQFLERYGKNIFGNVPIIFAGLSIERYNTLLLPEQSRGIIASLAAKKNIELIRHNHPRVSKIFVISGDSPVEQDALQEAIREGTPYREKVDLIPLTHLTFNALLKKLRTLGDDSAVMYQTMALDAAGKVLVPAQVAADIANAASVPVYGMLDTYMGSGITGGFLIDHEILGRQAANIAIKWLKTGIPPNIKLEKLAGGAYKFDARQLQRWGIRENALPAGSQIEFRTFNLWDSYSKEIIGCFLLIILQTLTITMLLRSRSKRLKTEAILRDSEQRLLAAQKIAHVGDWELDVATNQFSWSDELYRIYGYQPQEIKPSYDTVLQTLQSGNKEAFLAAVDAALKGEKAFDMEYDFLRKDGTVSSIHAVGQVIYQADGTPWKMRGIAEDITERKQGEEEKSRLHSRLLQSQKMEAIGNLAGGVAHDFNNMLGVILGHTELAIEKVDRNLSCHANLAEIRKAAIHSADLTKQLLAFARKETAAPTPILLNDVVTHMLRMLQRLIGEDIVLHWQPEDNLWPVKVDPAQIDQILANLCVNARDAITGVGNITIETGNISFDQEYCTHNPGTISGDYVQLTVNDDGIGMSQEVLGKIFEPFFTTKGLGKGTGLGLATVYGIVKQNNGFINVFSEAGQGTSFKLFLPRYLGKDKPAPSEIPQELIIGGHETLLVVEDEPSLLYLNRCLLEGQGYRVLTASTPKQALHLAAEYKQKINLLITDVVMPEMNGLELSKRMLSLYPDMKCLFTSGYTANIITHRGILDEGIHFIKKPFSRKDLMAKVREVLGQH